MKRLVTLRDIASKVGMHFTTVGLALKNDARIHADTRQRIQQAAREMGYCPNPMVSALAVYRNAIRPAAFHGVIAWLSNVAEPEVRPGYLFTDFYEGARDRAAELGYRIEEFPFRQPGMTPERYVRILQSRGISGILVAPQPVGSGRARIEMDWTRFAGVSFGYSLEWPLLPRVSSDHFRDAKLAVNELIQLGYCRVGLCLDATAHERVDGAWEAGYLLECRRQGLHWIEPLILKRRNFLVTAAWIRRSQLDAVVSLSGIVEGAARVAGWRIPKDIACASLHLFGGEQAKATGINQNDRNIGAAAANLLISSLHLRETGPARLAQTILIEGTWHRGNTARRQVKGRAPTRK